METLDFDCVMASWPKTRQWPYLQNTVLLNIKTGFSVCENRFVNPRLWLCDGRLTQNSPNIIISTFLLLSSSTTTATSLIIAVVLFSSSYTLLIDSIPYVVGTSENNISVANFNARRYTAHIHTRTRQERRGRDTLYSAPALFDGLVSTSFPSPNCGE